MPSYYGFSTINANKPQSTNLNAGVDGGYGSTVRPIVYGKKFKLVDEQLIVQDFINALNIQQGQKVGQPQYGTTIWSFIFEPNTLDTQTKLQNEILRVASLDPRMLINSINVYPQDNGILIEIEMAIAPMNNAFQLSVFFDNLTNRAVAQ